LTVLRSAVSQVALPTSHSTCLRTRTILARSWWCTRRQKKTRPRRSCGTSACPPLTAVPPGCVQPATLGKSWPRA
jgi:hypothetical protein